MKRLLIDLAFPFLERAVRDELERAGTVRLYKKHEMIVRMGEPMKYTFLILNGFVKAYRTSKKGEEFVLYYLHAGHGFAVSITEGSDEKPESLASFEATEPTNVLLLSFEEKDRIAKKYNSFYKYILKTAVMHYGFYTSLIDSLVFNQLDVRIAYFLSRLSKAKEKTKLKISHQEIANGLNVSRESVSRLLKLMEAAGKIRLGHGELEIIDLLH